MALDLSGCWVPLITPFNKDFSIDEKGLRELVDYFVQQGVQGLVPVGTTGESPTLDHEEHSRVIEMTIDQAAGRLPVMAGTGSNATSEAISLTVHAEKAGADATLQVAPYYNKPTQEGMKAHFAEVAKRTKLPVVIYNIPGRTAKNVEPETLLTLGREVDNIVGVKDAAADMNQTMRLLEVTRSWSKPFFHLTGEDALTFANLSLGGHGAISAVANVIPKEMTDLCRLAREGKWSEAQDLHYRILDLVRVLFIEPNPVPVKEALALMGLPAGPVRLPLTPLQPVNRDRLKKALKNLDKI
ncbi:MAG: 4-hydroxy-tetrahydrodipicolinate synthase [Deltaproteobacteria bacterium]|nr:4-hydroxy-tetrahydrodipicolinate synthase [Deltaproteobacteria bacterium]